MDYCAVQASSGDLTLSTLTAVQENYLLVSSAVAVHQTFLRDEVLPSLFQSGGPQALPSNLQGLYYIGDIHRNKATELLQQVVLGRRLFKNGIPLNLIFEARKSVKKFYETTVRVSFIELTEVLEGVSRVFPQEQLKSKTESHYSALIGSGTKASGYMVGLLFSNLPLTAWGTLAAAMSSACPGWFSVVWYVLAYRRSLELPLARVREKEQRQRNTGEV
mmetsp:Transcript_33026/g.78353  ORF Transcript_33026/g.78353 Transcript_33026/m.78353 type:complete len:219 (-) Transcript_33026:134-790(-)